MHRICSAIWETGEWPEEWTCYMFIPLPKKSDLNVQVTEQLLLSHVQARSFGSYWQGSEWRPKQKLQTNGRDSDKEGDKRKDQITNLRILIHKAREHQQPLYICVLWTSRRHSIRSPMISYGWLYGRLDIGHRISSARDWLAGQTVLSPCTEGNIRRQGKRLGEIVWRGVVRSTGAAIFLYSGLCF